MDALPKWGKQLYDAAIAPAVTHDAGRNAFSAWNQARANTERRFSVLVDENFLADPALGDEAKAAKEAQAKEAAALLLSLPWELAHDDRDYLFQGARGVRVRRRLPNQITKDPLTTTAPLRVLLVSPKWAGHGHRKKIKVREDDVHPLTLGILAALSAGHQVRIVDEHVEPVPFDEPWDLVGITATTYRAPRAYAIADRFRARRVPVVLGGIHPTLLPEEGLGHADAVVRGEAESTLPSMSMESPDWTEVEVRLR